MRSFHKLISMPFAGVWIAPALMLMTMTTLKRAYGAYMGEQVGIYGGVFIAWLASVAIGNLVALVLSLSATCFILSVGRFFPRYKSPQARDNWMVGLVLPIPFFVFWLLHDWALLGPRIAAPLLAATLLISPWLVVVGIRLIARDRMAQKPKQRS